MRSPDALGEQRDRLFGWLLGGADQLMAEVYETLAPEAAFPGLMQARGVVGLWLTIELAKHHAVPLAMVDDVFNRLPTNYANLLDSAEGVNLLSIMVGEALGQPEVEPFYRRLQ